MLDELAVAAAVAARRRRGALHLRVGPRLPARLPAARRGDRGARAPDRARPHRDGGAAGPRRDRRAARAARRRCVVTRGFDRPNIRLASSATRTRTASCGRCASTSAAAEPPGIVYVATRRARRGARRGAVRRRAARGARTTRACARARPRRRADALHGRRPRRRSSRRPRSGWASTSRTSAGSCTRRSPSRSTATTRRSAAPAATAQPAWRSLFYRPEDLGLRRFFSGGGRSTSAEIAAVLDAVGGRRPGRDVRAAGRDRSWARRRLATALSRLEEVGRDRAAARPARSRRPTTRRRARPRSRPPRRRRSGGASSTARAST